MLSYKGVLFYTVQRDNYHYWYLINTVWPRYGVLGCNTRTLARQEARRAIDHYASKGYLSIEDMASYKHRTGKG